MEEEVLEFIKRRFPIDCKWTDGNCYWFAKILAERFGMQIYYLPIVGHFVAGFDSDGKFYDYNGVFNVTKEDKAQMLKQI